MRQEHALRRERQIPIERLSPGIGVELHRRGRRHHERTGRSIEFTIRQAKGITGKKATADGVPDTEVMARIARRVDEQQAANAESPLSPALRPNPGPPTPPRTPTH